MNKLPLYTQVESLLRSKILSGRFSPGERLPTKEELAKQFNVSKITISGALSNLTKEGLINTTRGRGTFVADKVEVPKHFIIISELPEVLRDGVKYRVKVLDIQSIPVTGARSANDIQAFFGLSGKDRVNRVRRIRLIGETPAWFVENILPMGFAEPLSLKEFSKKPLIDVIREKTGVTIGKAELYLEAVSAEPDIAEILRCNTCDPLIHIRILYYLPSGEPMELSDCYLRGDYYKYKVDLTPDGSRPWGESS
jgi:DNA-binding GntR family transcriptional regulator